MSSTDARSVHNSPLHATQLAACSAPEDQHKIFNSVYKFIFQVCSGPEIPSMISLLHLLQSYTYTHLGL